MNNRRNNDGGYSRGGGNDNRRGYNKKGGRGVDNRVGDGKFIQDRGFGKGRGDSSYSYGSQGGRPGRNKPAPGKPAGQFDGKLARSGPGSKLAGKPGGFARKTDNSKKSDRKVNKRNYTDDNNIKLVESVEDEKSGMVYGRNAVIELLRSGKTVDKLYVQSGQREGSMTVIVAEAVKRAVPVIEAEKPKLDAMINNSSHQGAIALASEKDYCAVGDILAVAEERGEKPFILVADKIMDPHNLGAIIRTAECAGVHGIIIPRRNSAGVSPVVAKTSAGASIHMQIAKVANIATTLEELKAKGVWIFSAVSGGEGARDYFEADYSLAAALVVGNEGEGLAPLVIKNSDFLVRIPMAGQIGSLNVSCASAILLYEAAKQRMNM